MKMKLFLAQINLIYSLIIIQKNLYLANELKFKKLIMRNFILKTQRNLII